MPERDGPPAAAECLTDHGRRARSKKTLRATFVWTAKPPTAAAEDFSPLQSEE